MNTIAQKTAPSTQTTNACSRWCESCSQSISSAFRRFKKIAALSPKRYLLPNCTGYLLLSYNQPLARACLKISVPLLAVGTLSPLKSGLRWCGRKLVSIEPRLNNIRQYKLWSGVEKAARFGHGLYGWTLGFAPDFIGTLARYMGHILEISADAMPKKGEQEMEILVSQLLKEYLFESKRVVQQQLQDSTRQLEDFLVDNLKSGATYHHLKKSELVKGLADWLLRSSGEGKSLPEQHRHQLIEQLTNNLAGYQTERSDNWNPPPAPTTIETELTARGYHKAECAFGWHLYIAKSLQIEGHQQVAHSCLRTSEKIRGLLEQALTETVDKVYQRLYSQEPQNGARNKRRKLQSPSAREMGSSLRAGEVPLLMTHCWSKEKSPEDRLSAQLTPDQISTFKNLFATSHKAYGACIDQLVDDLQLGVTPDQLPCLLSPYQIRTGNTVGPVYCRRYQHTGQGNQRLGVYFTIDNGVIQPLAIGLLKNDESLLVKWAHSGCQIPDTIERFPKQELFFERELHAL